jgi:hypothetical protein
MSSGSLEIGSMAIIWSSPEFEPDDVKEKIERAAAFLQAIRMLLSELQNKEHT